MSSSSVDYTATLPRKRMGAGVLFTNAAGQVLLVEPTYKDSWETPGGTVEANESPYDAAVREVKEEQRGRTEGVTFLYAGGVLDQAREAGIRLPAEELRSWAWCNPAESEARLWDFASRTRSRRMRCFLFRSYDGSCEKGEY
jgi:8-oxo-dGTP diphosphatase